MSDTLEATGKVTGIEERAGGFRRISVDVGSQYPLRVDTKKDDIIQQAREAMEWPAALVRYTEQPSKNINEKTGEPFTNRYVSAFLPVTPADMARAGAASSGNGGGYRSVKDLDIVRESALKSAFNYGAYAFSQAKEEGDRARLEIYLMALAGRLEGWILRPAEDAEADEPPPLTDQDAPVVDEDIPFV